MNARRLKKRINPECKDVSIQVSYGTADVRNTLKQMFDNVSTPCGESFACSLSISEPELLQYFERTIFGQYEAATLQAIKKEFVITGTKENSYYLSPILAKRVGRPRKGSGK